MKEINGILDFFQNLNEFIYVADIETHELVYMNKKTLDAYGFTSVEEIKGKPCYEILQKSSIPCGMCNNDKLCVGAFEEWRYYNPVVDKYLLLKDTLIIDPETQKKYRIEIAIDITEEHTQDKAIQKYRDIETLVNQGLRIALSADTPDETIQIILEHLGKSLNGERTYIFEKNQNGGDDNTYEWTAAGITLEIDNLQDLPAEVCARWYRCFNAGEYIAIPDLEETKETDPLQYENLKRQGIHSIVVMPIYGYGEGEVKAFYGVDNPPDMDLEYISDMLQIMSSFLASSLKRRNLMRKLEDLSYKDALTRLGNRFALANDVEKLDREQSIAIVYCDLTGLKAVNDSLGHEAGDQLLIRACRCLEQAFGDYRVYRIGGDEFLAICSPIDRKTFDERVELLKTSMQAQAVNMAVGAIWREEATENLYPMVLEAERRMYADKAAYYQKNGIDRRRH